MAGPEFLRTCQPVFYHIAPALLCTARSQLDSSNSALYYGCTFTVVKCQLHKSLTILLLLQVFFCLRDFFWSVALSEAICIKRKKSIGRWRSHRSQQFSFFIFVLIKDIIILFSSCRGDTAYLCCLHDL